MPARGVVVGAWIIVLAGAAACGAAPRGGVLRDTAEVRGKVTGVRLDTAAGRVTVRGAARASTVVRRVVTYRGGKPGRSYGTGGGTLTLRDCGRQCAVDYTVDVPAGVAVAGSVEAGAIRLVRVGRVGVAAETGPVEVTARGPVVVRTRNGPVDVTLTRPADVRAATDNGGIDLSVPKAGYRVSARVTGAGNTGIGVRNRPDAEHRLDLRTGNGNIDVH